LKRIVEIIRTLLFAATVIYVVGVFVFLALRLLMGDSTWWMGFLNTFARWVFAPAFLLLPLALLLRAKRGLLVLVPALVVGIIWYAPDFMPRARETVPADAPQIRVVTANIWGSNRSFAESAQFEAMGDWLRTLDADVALLQEVPFSQRMRTDGILGLEDVYPEQMFSESSFATRAALSRLPVVSWTIDELNPSRWHFQRMVVELGGKQIAIYVVHMSNPLRDEPRLSLPLTPFIVDYALSYDPARRDQQVRYLLAALEQETLPYIVGGDFNMSDQSLIYNEVAAVMRDSFREAGWGFGTSWRAGTRQLGSGVPPLIRIDYLWHSDDFVTLTSEQGPFLGSDHLPLVSTFAITGN
jgi:endonuclease/exonuclease/phosphatase (EEP) superfamily protein YafD